MVSQNTLAVKAAMSLLGAGSKTDRTVQVVPTAKTRAALDYLAGSSLEELTSQNVNLREVASDLFNWHESGPKATKTVIRALNEALTVPGKYAHAVELVGFLAAAAPHLEPDRIARLFTVVTEVDTAFAPTRYTLQFHARIGKVFNRYSSERAEKLFRSLWVQSHTGRWWDLTAGRLPDVGEIEPVDIDLTNMDAVVKGYVEGSVPWSPVVADVFRTIPETYQEPILNFLRAYRHDWSLDKPMDPDIALLASYIPWLESDERLESPVSGLLDLLIQYTELIEGFTFPDKPKQFTDLFPNILLYEANVFPFFPSVLKYEKHILTTDSYMEIVQNTHQLQENRDYMGNCTWSYKNRMEKGEYVLFRIHHKGAVYNASMTLNRQRNTWNVGEVNSRHNRGNVPANIRSAFEALVKEIKYSEAEQLALETVTGMSRKKLKKQLRYQT